MPACRAVIDYAAIDGASYHVIWRRRRWPSDITRQVTSSIGAVGDACVEDRVVPYSEDIGRQLHGRWNGPSHPLGWGEVGLA